MTNQHLKNSTRGQLERALSQQFQKLYREQLGHSTGKVSCRLFDNKLTIVVEDSLTQPEQLLLEKGSSRRVEELHTDLAQLMRPQLINLVESTLGLEVIDLLSDTTLATARTGLVVILSGRPEMVVPCNKQSPAKSAIEAKVVS